MTIINKSMLSRPRKLTFPHGWCGHIPFVSWLVEEMKPDTIIELGTHSGNSYFAICQAVLDNNTGSKCYAVDTWQGDEHAGKYSEDVFNDVNAWNQQYFSEFSNLLRMTFDQASEYFSEGSINLLHIDGLHTYTAVKHDFDTWYPKLADNAIVLFHDTNVRERKFGVWQLWEELHTQYPSFEFLHSHGLGVLFIGKKSHMIYEKIMSLGNIALIRKTFSRLGELITLREDAHNQIKCIESEKYEVEQNNKNLKIEIKLTKNNLTQKTIQFDKYINHERSENEFLIKKIQEEKNINNMLSDRLNKLENSKRNQNIKINKLEGEIYQLINSHSWKITKPFRFLFRLLRGQQKDPIIYIKKETRDFARYIYYRSPYKHREKLLSFAFKLRPNWFEHHPQFMIRNTNHVNSFVSIDNLTEISTLSANISEQPGKIAVHCHIFYSDLIDEFVSQLSTMPFSFDVYISVSAPNIKKLCQIAFKKIPRIEKLTVHIVNNRGRDIAPIFVEFGAYLRQYDFICHIQTKKSLYNGGKTTGWREYLVESLFGTKDNVQRIFKAFVDEPSLGIIYSQAFSLLPYQAFTWLANKKQGTELCARMGITCPDGYFNFPAGSMFWARTKALAPLFDLNLGWTDFPKEKQQTDGTTAHTIERLFGIVPHALHYTSLIIKDAMSPSNSTFRWDQQYFPRTMTSIKNSILDPSLKIIAFDIFDTLLVRDLLHPDHTKQLVASQLSECERDLFLKYRSIAESNARERLMKDVSIIDIYDEMLRYDDIDELTAKKMRALEESVEINSVSCRQDMLDIFNFTKRQNKKIIIISDMFLTLDTIAEMLTRNGYDGWNDIYLSSDKGIRKDSGELYKLVLSEQQVSGNEVLMFGDNERSDLQLPCDEFGIRGMHIVRATDLALNIPEYSFIAKKAFAGSLDDEITFSILVKKNLSKIADFSTQNIKLFSSDPYHIGFNLVGPLLTSFSEWLRKTAQSKKISELYFLAREGELMKKVYDLWCRGLDSSPNSHYLVVSRRSVNVPSIENFDDVLAIAKSTFYANTLELFLRERYGLKLSDAQIDEIYNTGLWEKGKLVEIQNNDISDISGVLHYLLSDIISTAKNEKMALINYLENEGVTELTKKSVVDVGYSGTIQKSLIKLLSQKIDGLYLSTLSNVTDGLDDNVAQGCFVDASIPIISSESMMQKHSFALEKLLSADSTQIIKYIIDELSNVSPVFKDRRAEDLLTVDMRAALHQGCFEFVNEAQRIRQNIYPNFTPSLSISDELFREFILSDNGRNEFIQKMTLDDDYCGRGLVS